MEFFDTHAHYYADAFDADREEFVAALPEHGVTKVVCPGCALESSRKSRDLAEQFPFFYFAANANTVIQMASRVTKETKWVVLAIIGILALMELCRRSVGVPFCVCWASCWCTPSTTSAFRR